MHFILKLAAIWLLGSSTLILGVIAIAKTGRAFLRLKQRMLVGDNTLPLPPFDRRSKQRTDFQLRLTRRPLTREEGRAIETLRHAVDYLIDTYQLAPGKCANDPIEIAQEMAIELMLGSLSALLDANPPLPSFAYLLRRRIVYALVTARQ